MDADQSEFLKVVTDHANAIISTRAHAAVTEEERRSIFEDAFDYSIHHLADLAPERHSRACKSSGKRKLARIKVTQKIKRHLLKRFADAFDSWDSALAASEFINREINHSSVEWILNNRDSIPALFDVGDVLGGKCVRLLILMGMHARMTAISSEILFLLSNGYAEGAFSRMRTLYELVIKSMFLCTREPTADGFELAERYHMSAMMELSEQEKGGLDEADIELMHEATNRWGDHFFKSNNNWAAPGLNDPSKKRVTFRDLEEALEVDELREIYLICNEAVHAGARKVISSSDFRRVHFNDTHGVINLSDTAYIGDAACFFLKMASIGIVRRIAADTCDWDLQLAIAPLAEYSDAACEDFYRWCNAHNDSMHGMS